MITFFVLRSPNFPLPPTKNFTVQPSVCLVVRVLPSPMQFVPSAVQVFEDYIQNLEAVSNKLGSISPVYPLLQALRGRIQHKPLPSLP
jgi:hypothetical protein